MADGWRKLVVDGVTATPVDAAARRRGEARRRRRAPRRSSGRTGPRGSTAAGRCAQRAPALTGRRFTHAGRRRAAGWSRGKAVLVRAAVRSGTTATAASACRGSPLSAATRISRDKERQVQHYVELLRTLPLWERNDPRGRRRLRQGVHEPRARRLRPRGGYARRARRPST